MTELIVHSPCCCFSLNLWDCCTTWHLLPFWCRELKIDSMHSCVNTEGNVMPMQKKKKGKKKTVCHAFRFHWDRAKRGRMFSLHLASQSCVDAFAWWILYLLALLLNKGGTIEVCAPDWHIKVRLFKIQNTYLIYCTVHHCMFKSCGQLIECEIIKKTPPLRKWLISLSEFESFGFNNIWKVSRAGTVQSFYLHLS